MSDSSPSSLEYIADFYFELSQDLHYLYANRAYLEFIEKDLSIVGKPFLAVPTGRDISQPLKAFRRCLLSQELVTTDDFCERNRRWFQYRVHPTPAGLSIFVVDITVQKKNELGAIADRERLHAMFEGSSVGIAQLALDGRWLELNARCLEILGVSAGQLQGRFKDICLAQDATMDQVRFTELISGREQRFVSERQIIRQDKEDVWVRLSVSVIRTTDGKPRFFAVVMEDISVRKEAEDSLNFALQASKMGEWDYDATRDITVRSRKFDELFGYPGGRESWTYEDFISHVHSGDQDSFIDAFRASLASGEDFNFECRIVWPDRSEHWILFCGRIYMDRHGRAVRIAGLVDETTSEKMAGQELQNAKLAAEDATREKSYFLANMSHEIRTPLSAIIGFTEVLKDSSLPLMVRDRYLEIVNRNAGGLVKLINDILDLSKVEAGFLEIEEVKISPVELLDEVVALLKVKADAKQVEIRVQSDSAGKIVTDPIRLRQILLNVIGNALKFTDSGHVTIKLSRVVETERPRIVFCISDTGPGIAAEAATRLFNPFTQADSSTTRKFGGTGLGLALSRRLAQALGGDLILEKSVLGIGSTFSITVPTNKALTEEKSVPILELIASHGHRMKQSLRGLRVLLADDSHDNQELIKLLLDKKGVNTEVADDGAEAVEKALQQDFDLVLMDMQMPKLDGYQATRELRKSGFTGKIVALTANAMRHDRDKCLEAGCSEYISKPIEADKLYQLIETVKHDVFTTRSSIEKNQGRH